ncbi:MAG: hypothetical protein RL199_97 [Pseudomonadota bacterium]
MLLAASSAQAMGLALQGGRFTPSGSMKGLLDSQWQFGVRALVPPLTPLGVIPSDGLGLDLGVDWAVHDVSRASTEGLATKRANITAIYRYTVPVDESVALYAGLGGRASVLWGSMSDELKSGSLWSHLRGALSVTGGLDWMLVPGLCFDARLSYGVMGFTAWEATGGLLLMF